MLICNTLYSLQSMVVCLKLKSCCKHIATAALCTMCLLSPARIFFSSYECFFYYFTLSFFFSFVRNQSFSWKEKSEFSVSNWQKVTLASHTNTHATQWIELLFDCVYINSVCVICRDYLQIEVKAVRFLFFSLTLFLKPMGKMPSFSMNINSWTKEKTQTKIKHYFCRLFVVCHFFLLQFWFFFLAVFVCVARRVVALWCIYSLYICINILLKTFNQKVTLSPCAPSQSTSNEIL